MCSGVLALAQVVNKQCVYWHFDRTSAYNFAALVSMELLMIVMAMLYAAYATDAPTMQPTISNETQNPTLTPSPTQSPTSKDGDSIQKISIFYIIGAGIVLLALVLLFYHCCCKTNDAKRKIAAAMKEEA